MAQERSVTQIGYARVSTRGQDPGPQIAQLTAAGCEKIFVEKASGASTDRPELAAMLAYLRPGDVVTVVQLARLSRGSLASTLALIADLEARGVEFRSLTDSIDTTSATGRALFSITAIFSRLELEIRRERQEAAWAAGKQKGRPPVLSADAATLAQRLVDEGQSLAEIARQLNVSKSAVWRAVRRSAPVTASKRTASATTKAAS